MIPVPDLTGVRVVAERFAAQSAYPFSLPFVRDLDLRFDSPVTFFVGENGTGPRGRPGEVRRRGARSREAGRHEPLSDHARHSAQCREPLETLARDRRRSRCYGVESMNWLPSGSLNSANVPHCSFRGGVTNSTPRATSS